MTERGMQVKSDMNKEGWERADAPIVCETCLGDNPYVRMTKEPFGKACKICERPFTVFRWRPGSRGRYKKTEICQTCAKIKNVCQTCILDLVYGLPVEVRDSFLARVDPQAIVVPESDVGREYYSMQQMKRAAEGDLPMASQKVHEGLLALARKHPRYERNLAHLCSFFARGECTRGASCPYRHEMPKEQDPALAKQNIKDRFYGKNDPVAAKILARARKQSASRKPRDNTVRKLYIGGLTEVIGRDDIQDALYSFGEITSIRLVPRQRCAFVEFARHEEALAALEGRHASLVVKGVKLHMNWANDPKAGAGATGGPKLLGADSTPLRYAASAPVSAPPTAAASAPPKASGAGAGAGAATTKPAAAPSPAAAAAAVAAAAAAPSTAAPAPAAAVPAAPEAYPGQHLGLPTPPGFKPGVAFTPMPFVPGSKSGTGPMRPDTRAQRHRPMYPSMSTQAMGTRLPTT